MLRALLIDEQFGVTDNVEKEHMRDFELDLFLNFDNIWIHMEIPDAKMLSSGLPGVEHKAGTNEIAAEPIVSRNRTSRGWNELPTQFGGASCSEGKLAILECFPANFPLWRQK